MYDGGAAAVDNVKDAANAVMDVFSSEEDDARTGPVAATNDTTRRCDGPHRGRLQVQGYAPRIDPFDFSSSAGPSWGWYEPCQSPLRAMGLAQLSTNLLLQTRNINFASAGLRGAAFAKMSQHISSAPSNGFYARHVIGWNHNGQRALGSGRNVPRVDL